MKRTSVHIGKPSLLAGFSLGVVVTLGALMGGLGGQPTTSGSPASPASPSPELTEACEAQILRREAELLLQMLNESARSQEMVESAWIADLDDGDRNHKKWSEIVRLPEFEQWASHSGGMRTIYPKMLERAVTLPQLRDTVAQIRKDVQGAQVAGQKIQYHVLKNIYNAKFLTAPASAWGTFDPTVDKKE